MKKLDPKSIRLLVLGAIVTVFAVVGIAVSWFYKGPYVTELCLEDYVTVGLDANGIPSALLDVDAILTDLKLPNPKYADVDQEDYADVNALCNMSLYLSYVEDPSKMRVTVLADTQTLKRYGIVVESLVWDQTIRGFVAGTTPTPNAAHTPLPTASASPTPHEPHYLTSLLNEQGEGLNLRSVCERVHSERDSLVSEVFGNNFTTDKTQVAFIVYASGRHHNLYVASYTVEETEAEEPLQGYFRVELYDLYANEEGVIGYGDVDVFLCESEEASEQLPKGEGVTVTRLYDGGVKVSHRLPFDQNGFVRFPNRATSYEMANGVYWSPTYDLLSEDDVWSLTATDQNSLANLLRYARKEIYARYYAAFDPKTEREFYEHYREYDWYEERSPDWTDRMTEAEQANVRLLREIQSLIEK